MKLTLQLGKRSYDIIINRGSLKKAGQLANFRRRVLVVTDKGVPEKYVSNVLKQCEQGHLLVLEPGEESKSIETWQTVLAKLLELNFSKEDAVAAVGGGVVCDVAGFAAATYMLGIPLLQLPTTTLAQADAAIGGKAVVNQSGVKNVAGAYHQPELVVADPDVLATLDKRHYASGLVEALKVGLVGSSELFELLENGDIYSDIERILYLSVRYKKNIVESDETGKNERKLLNFGHTLGHGIEQAGGLHTFTHGESIALGMLPFIESRTLLRRTKTILKKWNLPLKHNYTAEQVLSLVFNQHHSTNGITDIVRVKQLGQGYVEQMDEEELRLLVKSG